MNDESGVDILFRDERIVVVNKPSGVAVHRGVARDPYPMLQRVRDAVGQKIWLAHRLDRATSGALLLALDVETASALMKQFEERVVSKGYLALVRGPAPARQRIEHAIRPGGEGDRVEATTELKPLGTRRVKERTFGWVQLQPETGRRHQLRLHLRHLNTPIVGDSTWGDSKANRRAAELIGLKRLALHASWLSLRHPTTGDAVALHAPIPANLAEPIESLGLPTTATWPLERSPGPNGVRVDADTAPA